MARPYDHKGSCSRKAVALLCLLAMMSFSPAEASSLCSDPNALDTYTCADSTALSVSCPGHSLVVTTFDELACAATEVASAWQSTQNADSELSILVDTDHIASARSIHVATGQRLRIKSSRNSTVTLEGTSSDRLFRVSNASRLSLQSMELAGGRANTSGGLVFAEDSDLSFSSCILRNGSVSAFEGRGYGGAVAIHASDNQRASMTMSDSLVHWNTVESNLGGAAGGALSVRAKGSGTVQVNISRAVIMSNTLWARGNETLGAGVFLEASTGSAVSIESSYIGSNYGTAAGVNETRGGGLHLQGTDPSTVGSNGQGPDLVVSRSSFVGNWGKHGAGVSAEFAGTVSIEHTTFGYNYANADGGAVHVRGVQRLEFDNASIYDNWAYSRGGGIFAQQSRIVLVNSKLERNSAWGFGGCIAGVDASAFLMGTTVRDCRVDSYAQAKGGAVHLKADQNSVTLDIEGSSLSNNHVNASGVPYCTSAQSSMGGAVAVEAAMGAASTAAVLVNISGSTFQDNSVHEAGLRGVCTGRGGAVSIQGKQGSGAVNFREHTVFVDNSASGSWDSEGGALFVDGNPDNALAVNLNGVEFRRNTAHSGGAVSIFSGVYGTVTHTSFLANAAVSGSGGALKLYQVNPMELSNVSASQNNASSSGGVVFIESATVLRVSESRLSNNEASSSGGVLQAEESCTATFTRSVLDGNRAPDGAMARVDDSTLSTYFSEVHAHGANVSQPSPLVLASGSYVVLDSCEMDSGDAARVVIQSDGNVVIRNSHVTGEVVSLGDSAHVATCADLGSFMELSCPVQYCMDSGASASWIGVSCYCDTTVGPRDPTWEGCEDPPKVHVLQSSFSLKAAKPAQVKATVLFVNAGDHPLFWRAQVAATSQNHVWRIAPSTGNLSACEPGNFTISVPSTNLSTFQGFELTVDLESNTHPFDLAFDTDVLNGGAERMQNLVQTRLNTTQTIDVSYLVQAQADPMRTKVHLGDSNGNVAGEPVKLFVRPHDVDGLWIKGSGMDIFTAAIDRVLDSTSRVCEVGYDADANVHRVACPTSPFETGDYVVRVAQVVQGTSISVGNLGVELACDAARFIATNNQTCGCPRGSRLNVARQQCTLCPAGKFGDLEATPFAPDPCQDCGPVVSGSLTVKQGQTNASGCVCSPAFYYRATETAEDNLLATSTIGECADVPEGAKATRYGTKVTTLEVEPGYWRVAKTSDILLECPVKSLCVGSNKSLSLCGPNNHGPYCAVCNEDFYKTLSGTCESCEDVNMAGVITTICLIGLLFVGGVCAAFVYSFKKLARREAEHAVIWNDLEQASKGDEGLSSSLPVAPVDAKDIMKGKRMRHAGDAGLMLATAAAANTNRQAALGESSPSGGGGGSDKGQAFERVVRPLKALVKELQILGYAKNVLILDLPKAYSSTLSFFSALSLDVGQLVPMGCMDKAWNFHAALVLGTIWPLVLVAICLAVYITCCILEVESSTRRALHSMQNVSLEIIFLFCFCVYTSVANMVFATWDCESFEGSDLRMLRADYSIDCDTAEHRRAQTYAGVMLIVYPLGIPAIFAYVLWRNRDKLTLNYYARTFGMAEQLEESEPYQMGESGMDPGVAKMYKLRMKDAELEQINFLFYEYRAGCYYFEVYECMRKMLMAGLLVFIVPGSALQIVTAMFIALTIFAITAYIHPHLYRTDSVIALVSQFCTFLLLLAVLMGKAESSIPSSLVEFIMWASIALPFLTFTFVVGMDLRQLTRPARISTTAATEGSAYLPDDKLDSKESPNAHDGAREEEAHHTNHEGQDSDEADAANGDGAVDDSDAGASDISALSGISSVL